MKWFVQNRVDWIDSRYVETPTVSVAGNQVTITAPDGAIYYTLDGTDPRAGSSSSTTQDTLLAAGSQVTAFIPDNDDLGTSWTAIGFDDSSWLSGSGGVGYDDRPDYDRYIGLDVTAAMDGINSTAYIRAPLTVSGDTSAYNFMALQLQYDDGFIAYLNGIPIAMDNGPDSPTWQSSATASRSDSVAVTFTEFDISDHLDLLQTGQNVLAIQGLNSSLTSSDFLISPRIVAGVQTGGGLFSPSAVHYSGPFSVTENAVIATRAYDTSHNIRETTFFSGLTTAALVIATPEIAVSEINYNPHDANLVPGLGELDLDNDQYEYIEVVNPSTTATVSLVGVQFSLGIEFNFTGSRVTQLAPGERVLVVRNQTAFESRYGLGLPIAGELENGTRLSNTSDLIRLEDGAGNVIQEFTYFDGGAWPGRPDGNGSSLVVIDRDGDYNDPENWRSSIAFGGTPAAAPLDGTPDIVVNELLSHSDAALLDKVELYNVTGQAIDLGGWHLSDTNDDYFKFTFDVGTLIQPREYLVLDESQLGFAFDGQLGDDIWLLEGNPNLSGKPERFADHFDFDATDANVSLGRVSNGDPLAQGASLFPMTEQTFGAPNGDFVVGGVILSEIHYHPAPLPPDQQGDIAARDLEFVELYNTSGAALAVGGWQLKQTDGQTFELPSGTLIPAAATLVLVGFDPQADPATAAAFRAVYGVDTTVTLVGPFDGRLDGSGETLKLLRPEDPGSPATGFVLVDRVTYDDNDPWPVEADGDGPSLTRTAIAAFGNFATSWQAVDPTPGSTSFESLVLLGDVNRDGVVNGLDVDPFVALVTSTTFQAEADTNQDGIVNGLDIGPFLAAVVGESDWQVTVDQVFGNGGQ
jgi:hypothetical protein